MKWVWWWVALVAAPARADTVVVESWAGARPTELQAAARSVAAAMTVPVVAGARLQAEVRARISTGAQPAAPETLAALDEQITAGLAAFASADFAPAVERLRPAVDGLAAASATLGADGRLRDRRQEALVVLAQALLRTRRVDEARAVFAEALRSFPALDRLPPAQLPPSLIEMGRALLRQRGASLAITSRPAGRSLFVDEQPLGATPRVVRELLPGRYRVYLAPGAGRTRGSLRQVIVRPGENVLAADSELDDHLADDDDGLRFDDDAERQRLEAPVACALGRALGADEVVVVRRESGALIAVAFDARSERRLMAARARVASAAQLGLALSTRREVEGVEPLREPAPMPPLAPATPPVEVTRPPLYFAGYRAFVIADLAAGAISTAAGLAIYFESGCDSAVETSAGRCAGGSTGRTLAALTLGPGAVALAVGVVALVVPALVRRR